MADEIPEFPRGSVSMPAQPIDVASETPTEIPPEIIGIPDSPDVGSLRADGTPHRGRCALEPDHEGDCVLGISEAPDDELSDEEMEAVARHAHFGPRQPLQVAPGPAAITLDRVNAQAMGLPAEVGPVVLLTVATLSGPQHTFWKEEALADELAQAVLWLRGADDAQGLAGTPPPELEVAAPETVVQMNRAARRAAERGGNGRG